MKMKDRNSQLRTALGAIPTKQVIEEVNNIPTEDTVNRQGIASYKVDDKLRLVSMLNTLKIEPQFYRDENEQMRELRDLIEKIGYTDPYFVAQAIVWSRCCGEGMRSINHLAAALLAPFISGTDWGQRFYSAFNKQESKKSGIPTGGCIFRADDMNEIKDVFLALNKSKLTNAMKKGFAKTIEGLDTYALAKYKKSLIDVINMVHPNPTKSSATISVDGAEIPVISALMTGMPVSADTWEVAQSEAGQEVAKAIKEGKITEEEGAKILAEAKADNWEALLAEGKLGILAALRNIRNMMKNPRKEMINNWCKLISNQELIRSGLILPSHFDLAYTIVDTEFNNCDYSHQVKDALLKAYQDSIPNLKEVFKGKTLVVLDCSGSMHCGIYLPTGYARTDCMRKAALIASTLVKAVDADLIRFGSRAEWWNGNRNLDLFTMTDELSSANMGCTNLQSAFRLITQEHKQYDRIVILSDNEVNNDRELVSTTYKNYVRTVCSPYIYAIDLAAYGTVPLSKEGKVKYMYGYGASMYEDLAKSEFDPTKYFDKILQVKI